MPVFHLAISQVGAWQEQFHISLFPSRLPNKIIDNLTHTKTNHNHRKIHFRYNVLLLFCFSCYRIFQHDLTLFRWQASLLICTFGSKPNSTWFMPWRISLLSPHFCASLCLPCNYGCYETKDLFILFIIERWSRKGERRWVAKADIGNFSTQ